MPSEKEISIETMAIATVPDQIRLRLRNIRLARGFSVREVASRCQMPPSSYSAIENGDYACSLQNLYRILEALGADISEVWPYKGAGEALSSSSRLSALRHQGFRLHELVAVLEADSAMLCVEEERRVSILLVSGLSQQMAARIAGYIETGDCPDETFSRCQQGRTFYLLASRIRSEVGRTMIGYYLKVWAEAFSQDPKLIESAKKRQLQPGQ